MSKILFITIFFVVATSEMHPLTQCTCNQILSEADCTQPEYYCAWNSNQNICGHQVPMNTVHVSYCDSYNYLNCAKQRPCAFVDGTCKFFTACTPFAKTSDAECKAISNRCTTDGTHCIEVTACRAFLKEISCVIDKSKRYCYWDTNSNTCQDAIECEQFPSTLTTDALCRAQNQNCTTTGRGCKKSGQNCSDSISKESCLDGTQKCSWTGSKCVLPTCENAPSSYFTDKVCREFTPDGNCTTKQNGGCVVRSTCEAAKVEEACVINIQGSLCFWNGSACVDKTCGTAPKTYKTNFDCQTHLSTCITNGSGCVTNITCSSAMVENACSQDAQGNDCLWDIICKEKKCVNAPSINNTHQLCTKFLASCTVNQTKSGCIIRTCQNAPNYQTTSECESYLPNNNCIAKLGGGCTNNTTCSAITLDSSCVQNLLGKPCFWNQDLGLCVDRKCENAPLSYKNNGQCFSYLKTCIISPLGKGCVDKVCNNFIIPSLCTKDSEGNHCQYQGVCYQKQCALAPLNYTTFQECNTYLDTCTLSNIGTGCSPIPLICETITIQAACVQKQIIYDGVRAYGKCGWDGKSCIDAQCFTINKKKATTAECNEVIKYCVSANPINGEVKGCMDLPKACGDRLSLDNCQVKRDEYPVCLWNTITLKCIEKTCFTANQIGLPLTLRYFNDDSCKSYLPGCLMGNDSASCIPFVQNCSDLQKNDCINTVLLNGRDCFWNGIQCLQKTCQNLNLTNHHSCNEVLKTCTVNGSKTACMQLQYSCYSYSIKEQCYINSMMQQCTWDSNMCMDKRCTSADSSYKDDQMCENYLYPYQSCTVVAKINNGVAGGCVSKQNQCEQYKEQSQCYTDYHGSTCFWYQNKCWTRSTFQCSYINSNEVCEQVINFCKNSDNGCKIKDCSDYLTTDGTSTGFESVSSHDQCQAIDNSCTISNEANRNCQKILISCEQYYSASSCTYSQIGQCGWVSGTQRCVFTSSSCSGFAGADDASCAAYNPFCKAAPHANSTSRCIQAGCESKSGNSKTISLYDCQQFHSSCTVNNDNSQCITATQCENYDLAVKCSYNQQGNKCFWDSTACITISSSTCGQITFSDLINFSCQSYNSQCGPVRDGTTCIAISETCSSILDLNRCVISKKGPCIQSQEQDYGAQCLDITPDTPCNKLYLKQGTNYAATSCLGLLFKCIDYQTIGCQEKTCDNAYPPYTFQSCNTHLSSCTTNGVDKCVIIKATCASQSITACYQAQEGPCDVYHGQCVRRSCDTAGNSQTNSTCEAHLSTCTVARLGGCQDRTSCQNYTSAIQCKKNSYGLPCTWNSLKYLCSDLLCSNLEESNLYDTHEKCYNTTSIKCTVRSNNGSQVYGCQPLGYCNSYVIQSQCVVNNNGNECAWNTNINTPACQDKNCSAANKSYKDHRSCQKYLNTCTVAVIILNDFITVGGCIDLQDCSNFLIQDQCQIDALGNLCGWNGYKCANKSCATAQKSVDYSSHIQCQNYLPDCTISESGMGCTDLKQCQAYKTQNQCVQDNFGVICFWYVKFGVGQCLNKTCDHAPLTSANDNDCNNFLQGCALTINKCRIQICEDFKLHNDALCQAAMSTCTSNGINCVLRRTCDQALTKYACVTSSVGDRCQWIEDNQFCVIRNCLTAPLSLQSESQCSNYYPGCTTKNGGGCIEKTTCAAAKFKASCTTDVHGNSCKWDQQICRDKACQDYQGLTHSSCQKINPACTIGLNGYCATMTSCMQTLIQQACIEGTDGPCYWISQYKNPNGSNGACFQYSDCSSLTFSTNTQCNSISDQCITNGLNCVGKTLCSEINTLKGCVQGTDGDCAYTISQNGEVKCHLFTTCDNGPYTTIEACQQYHYGCTSDGEKCIAFSSCKQYKKAGCINSNYGQCIWDRTISACRKQNCTDFIGTTHSACSQQFYQCTSDGTNCITKAACSTYNSWTVCHIAQGKDAQGYDATCFWDTSRSTQVCRLMVCSDVMNGTTTAICSTSLSGCISDGQSCIKRSTCESYTTKASCNSGGTYGNCVFTVSTENVGTGTCALMTSCEQAKNDQFACMAVKDKCFWVPEIKENTTTPSSCIEHTCASYYATHGICSFYLNWNYTLYQFCTLLNGFCGTRQPTDLPESICFKATQYTYTWNSSTQKCTSCTLASTNETTNVTNNTTNQTNSTNITNNTIFGFKLIGTFISVIFLQ